MRRVLLSLAFMVAAGSYARAEDPNAQGSSNLRQYYSGKFGFYQPGEGLNNGLIFGIDGITEFVHYDFSLGGAIDLYVKQTFSFFKNAPPSIRQQAIVLIPIHANVGYQVFRVEDADTRGLIGGGIGYYLYFYSIEYSTAGGVLLPGTTQSESKRGGNLFGTLFTRVLIGKIFVEPRLYFAVKEEDTIPGGFTYVVDPGGFAVTIGFQY